MSGAADLTGQRVLIVEDDYYLAQDTARALRGAGAEVVGPFARVDAALDGLEPGAPTMATVNINLGDGPTFEIARTLHMRGVPFVFLTGYDRVAIPSEFEGVERLQKPVELRAVVEALVAKTPLAPGQAPNV